MLNKDEYAFLKTNPHLKDRMLLLTYGGSIAYGTNVEDSDVDLRGIAFNSKREILTGNYSFEQFVDSATDTVIYSFKKFCDLLVQCNPNIIEMLGCLPEQYLILSKEGKYLLDHASMFLSKRVANTFSGYANMQLTRLMNKCKKYSSQVDKERKILESMQRAMDSFKLNFDVNMDGFMLYIDDSKKQEFDKEIYCDIQLNHIPVRDLNRMMRICRSVILDFDHFGFRNVKAIQHTKLGKHMMHLVRLYMMGIEILETGQIHTFRTKEHDLLMQIRNGKFLDEMQQPTQEFFDLCEQLNEKYEIARKNTQLPDKPDYDQIDEFISNVNKKIILGEMGERK